ncbi:hypothetical protein GOBAR_AA15155 [Gossypium barbadense]|uniref:Uncharacterized protein n=1 Tax=Gossypium barbadense TaxID=3634 RepID=A0A2P5XQ67_GOSBA|nr:hypothetical protein GOBAR_AA15155 [Gossypium barbadense]
MKENGGDDDFSGEEISLLAEELIQLSVKSSMVLGVQKPLRRGIFVSTKNQSDIKKIPKLNFQEKDKSDMAQRIQDSSQFIETEKAMMIQEEEIVVEEKANGENNNYLGILKPAKKSSWKRIEASYKGIPRFKFEVWWTMEESIEREIIKSWESSNGPIVEKLERLQRAQANWLQLGDKNSAFFHKYALVRRRINTITRLKSDEGREISDESTINEAASNYFQNLFSSKGIRNLSHL